MEYQIEHVKSRSARGRVYLARGNDGTRFALKELVFATVPSVQHIEAFEREAAVLRQLRHPKIPQFIASFHTGKGIHTRLYLVQQCVEGPSLLEHLEHHRFSEREAVAIAHQVLDILQYLHGLSPRVLHRDIKPANLIWGTEGELTLVDFGAARDLSGDRTHGATLVGTFGYMPPEQLGGTVSPSSDLYSLGATLLHLLCRKPPSELINSRLELEFEDHLNVSEHFSQFLRRLVAVDSVDRFQSAQEARAALESDEVEPMEEPSTTPTVVEIADAELSEPLQFARSEVQNKVTHLLWASRAVGWTIAIPLSFLGLIFPTLSSVLGESIHLGFLLLGIWGFAIGNEVGRRRIMRQLGKWVELAAQRHEVSSTQLMEEATRFVKRKFETRKKSLPAALGD